MLSESHEEVPLLSIGAVAKMDEGVSAALKELVLSFCSFVP